MHNSIIARIFLFISMVIFGVAVIFQLDPRNLWLAYFMAAASSFIYWPLPRIGRISKQLQFVGQMPKMPNVFIYEITGKVNERVQKRVTTQCVKIAAGGEHWSAMCIIDSKLVDEFAASEKQAIALIMKRINAVK
jgi:hypothetical protein